jgi:reactive chlorine resistance protein C
MTTSAHAIGVTSAADARLDRLGRAGVGVLRYGLVFLLLFFGATKFAAFEAEAIRPLVENSPLLGWLYAVLGVRGVSAAVGVAELLAGLLIAARRWLPAVSGYASLAAAGIFLVTLSFLVTTPGALDPAGGAGGFLMKDVMLLGAALFTAAEALRAARRGGAA